MNFQKRLINTFKLFAEKVFLPHCYKNETVIADWNKFIVMLSSDNVNITEVQIYVDSIAISNQQNVLLMQSQQLVQTLPKKDDFYNAPICNKRKEDNFNFENTSPELSFNPNKTFGGEKGKVLLNSNGKQQYGEEPVKKQYANILNQNSLNKQQMSKFRSSTHNMALTFKQTSIENAPLILNSLENLYKTLIDNQQKIEALTHTNSQTVSSGQQGQSYY